jgi:hypothetical protein
MKKTKKLEIKKVTLRNLDEPTMDAMAGGITGTCLLTICIVNTCPTVPKTCIKEVCA